MNLVNLPNILDAVMKLAIPSLSACSRKKEEANEHYYKAVFDKKKLVLQD